MRNKFPVASLKGIETPFYYYETGLLKETLGIVKSEAEKYDFKVHYAVKANANDRILNIIKEYGMGVDCVSGNEVKKALETGFNPSGIVFAGVGKADWEITIGLDKINFFSNKFW